MFRARRFAFVLALAGLSALASRPAQATVVERVVAIIGDRAILLSDLKARARPFLVQVSQSVAPGAQRNAAISQVFKGVLDKIIDEELEERAAITAKINVSTKEIDEAIARVAAQNQVSVDRLLEEAERSGITEQQYREELRRQLLQAKLVNVRLQGRIRVTDEDLHAAYKKLVLEERQRLGLRVAWIRVAAHGKSPLERRVLAEHVAELAKSQDFASLARQYSDDPGTRARGGELPGAKLNELPVEVARISLSLDTGAVSPALQVGGDYVIVRVLSREATQLPAFDEARRELGERVYMDKMGQSRRTWLDGLRRQNHVELRL